jgi:hypothetical protein
MSNLSEKYPDLPALLAAIQRRPGMFLGTQTIRGLHLFLYGIDFAEEFHAISEQACLGGFDMAAFESWVESRYNPQRLSLNSFSLAEYLERSDCPGWDLWFSWFDEYRRSESH